MWTEVHNWFRRVGAVATTAWFVTFLAAGGNAYGQTRRHHGRHHGVPTAQAVLAQSQHRGPASSPTPAEISHEECPDREGSGTTAGQARTASRARDYLSAEALWSTAIGQCGLPDRYHGRAAAREGRQGTMPDGPERLNLVDAAIGDYQQALMRASLVDGFQTGPSTAALTALQEFRATLVARMQAPPAPTRVTAPPSALMCPARQLACGGACVELATDVRNCGGCGNVCPAGNVCLAGRCNTVLANNQQPTFVDHSGRRTVGTAMLITGGVLAAGAAVFYGLAVHNNNLQAAQDLDLMTRGCATTNAPDCVQLMDGATRPSEVADDHQKVAIALTVGAVAVAGTGLLLRLISPSAPARTTAFVDPRGLVGFTHHF